VFLGGDFLFTSSDTFAVICIVHLHHEEKKIDALDNWCLRRIFRIHWTDFVSNDVVRSRKDNRCCQILSVNSACPSLVICAVPTSVKTTPELSGSAFGVLPKAGDEELEDRGKPG